MTKYAVILFALTGFLLGCNSRRVLPNGVDAGPGPVLISITSDMESNPQSVDMAMRFAGFALDEKRDVLMFFNVKGATVPSTKLPEGAAFQQGEPIRKQLADLIQRGAKVHVCPVCMKALDVGETDLVEGAQVTTRGQLFAAITRGTCVFTY